jgi:hypothetical protein
MEAIRILTKAGKMIWHKAEIVDRITSDGEQYSVAIVGRATYLVVDRDADGAIWGA